MARWQEALERLDSGHRHMLQGGALSSLFLRYPLRVANPVLVGGFYGLLIGIALIPLAAYFGTISEWPVQAISLIGLTSLLGGSSLSVSMVLKRPPFPFLGLLTLGIGEFYNLEGSIVWVGMALLILPGPVYVHLSYAPRWRILSRLEGDLAPFEGMTKTIYESASDKTASMDSELDEVVGDA